MPLPSRPRHNDFDTRIVPESPEKGLGAVVGDADDVRDSVLLDFGQELVRFYQTGLFRWNSLI